jgi:hypothetical protein
MIKIIITSIILFIIFVIILLSFNVKIEYFNSGTIEPIISGNYISEYIDVDNVYYMFKSGTSTFTIISPIICDYLVVGGGGGGSTGGGGAGGFLYRTNQTLNPGTYTITVGNGGAGVYLDGTRLIINKRGLDGNDSSIVLNGVDIARAYKGGGGAGSRTLATAPNGIYGSTGGNGHDSGQTRNIFPPGTLVGGNIGGITTFGNGGGGYQSAGGGGGAGGPGLIGLDGNVYDFNVGARGGHGGIGLQCDITGTNVYYAGGGAGGTNMNKSTTTQRIRPTGGLGGGGNGSLIDLEGGTNGIPNTGGGGGGCDWEYKGLSSSGGSGVVIIRINNKTNSYIDNSTDCPVNFIPSGEIKQVPDTNMNISVISIITKINENTYNQAFGNGNITYTATFSKYLNDNYIPTNLFLRNNKTTAFAIGNYNNGVFNNNNIIIGYNSSYAEKGEYIHIRLPSNITLKRYGFRADKTAVPRAPGSWALYTGLRLLEPTPTKKDLLVNNSMKLDSNNYCQKNQYTYIHDIQTNVISGNELLFIFPSLAGSANVLSFMELLLYSS